MRAPTVDNLVTRLLLVQPPLGDMTSESGMWQHVFPAAKRSVDPVWGRARRDHVLEKLLQDALKNPVRLSGIAKPATRQTLRHSFATQLLSRVTIFARSRNSWDTKT